MGARICCVVLLLGIAVEGACSGGGETATTPTIPTTPTTPATPTPPEPPAPTPAPNKLLAFTSGAGASDTIDAANKVRLTVRALNDSGAPLPKVNVVFQVRTAPPSPPAYSIVTGSTKDLFVTTDSLGFGSTDLQLGEVAGTWYVVASDSRAGAIDSVAFTVRPGAPARVTLAPRDTALFVDGRYGIAATAMDRHGNRATATLTYSADSVAGVASVTSTGSVTGVAVGRSRFLVGVGGKVLDTARVTVVPPGKLVAVSDDGLSVFNMDGSSYRTLVPGRAYELMFPSWSPDGTAVAYNSSDVVTAALYRVDLQGTITKLSGTSQMSSETWPRYSADGQYIYFSGGYYPDSIDTYRMRADGTGARVRVTPFRPFSDRYWKASPSPDGTLLAYSEAGFALHVVSLVDGTDRTLPVPSWAEAPRFSPSGGWIAYANENAHSIELIRADGTGHRVITPSWETADDWGHDWSPDGAWIIYSRSGGLSIVRVADGLVLPLPFGRYLYAASWHQ